MIFHFYEGNNFCDCDLLGSYKTKIDGWHVILRPFQQYFSHIRTIVG